jgi:hypothetical protein
MLPLSAPVWGLGLACIVVIAVAILALLAFAIARLVVGKARPEDLPEIVTGLTGAFAALTGLLPWGSQNLLPPLTSASDDASSRGALAPSAEGAVPPFHPVAGDGDSVDGEEQSR